jgi:diphosphomevalonate decarboxylase
MRKATVAAPANIALIKYWGAKQFDPVVPYAPSLSMTLRACCTRTTVQFDPDGTGDDEILHTQDDGTLVPAEESFRAPIVRHLDRLRDWTDQSGVFRVATRNTFPSRAGLASSASGFAALTLATTRALGKSVDPTQASDLARRSGSGSAARSVFGGFVVWPREEDLCAAQIAPAEHWALCDLIAVVDTTPKEVSSREGHRRVLTSPFFDARLDHLEDRREAVQEALLNRDFERLAPLVEREATELHCIAMSSRPPIHYWRPATLAVLEAVRGLRADGVAACATMDAGPNVHVLCPPDAAPSVADRLEALSDVDMLIWDGIGAGPTDDVSPLF